MKKKSLVLLVATAMAFTLVACGGGSDTTKEASTTTEAAADEATDAGEGCSDETFAALQDNYATLVDAYNIVSEAYQSDEIEADASIEDALNQTADIINEMGSIDQSTIDESDAETLNGTIVDLLDVLGAVADAM